MALVACGSSAVKQLASGVKGASEVVASPTSTPGNNPFTNSVGTDKSGIRAPAAAASTSGGPATYNASLPGLYGGTRNYQSCNKVQLVNYLEQNPAKAQAWASTLGIQTTQIRSYVSGLTDVLLRTYTRVTNHGYVNGCGSDSVGAGGGDGRARRPVRQAGREVLLRQSVDRARPLLGSRIHRAALELLQHHPDHDHPAVDHDHQGFKLYDPATGKIFTRTPNGRDGPYTNSSPNTPQPSPSPGNPSAPPTTPASPSAPRESPSVSLSPNPVVQGQTVTLSASGFAPDASLQITVNRPDGVVEHDPYTADGSGRATYTFSNAAATAPLGTYNVTVANTATGASGSASIDVVAPSSSSSGNSGGGGTAGNTGNTGGGTAGNTGNTGGGTAGNTGNTGNTGH